MPASQAERVKACQLVATSVAWQTSSDFARAGHHRATSPPPFSAHINSHLKLVFIWPRNRPRFSLSNARPDVPQNTIKTTDIEYLPARLVRSGTVPRRKVVRAKHKLALGRPRWAPYGSIWALVAMLRAHLVGEPKFDWRARKLNLQNREKTGFVCACFCPCLCARACLCEGNPNEQPMICQQTASERARVQREGNTTRVCVIPSRFT